jgi:hypothetical protein
MNVGNKLVSVPDRRFQHSLKGVSPKGRLLALPTKLERPAKENAPAYCEIYECKKFYSPGPG